MVSAHVHSPNHDPVDSECRSPDPEQPGPKFVQQKPTPLPKLQLSVLVYTLLAEPITAHVMLPFIVQLVQETGITGGDVTKVGYYTGLIESLFFITEALTVLQWGRLSDRIGRRPVLLSGLLGLSLSMLSFGLAHTFWAVVASRAIAGALNGNTGVIKCMMGEITDETNMATGFSVMPLAWAAGNAVAPLIGGMFQHPYERIGGVFLLSDFWRRNPYFLPCSIAAIFAMSAFFLTFCFLKETAPCKRIPECEACRQVTIYSQLETVSMAVETISNPSERTPLVPSRLTVVAPPLRSLLTPRVLTVILNYSLLAIIEVSFYVLQPVFLSTPIKYGGLGMSPSLIGLCMAVSGVVNGLVSAICFSILIKKFGTKRMTTIGVSSFFGSFALFPLINVLARIDDRLSPAVWVAFAMQLLLLTLPPMAFSSIFMYLTHAAPSRSAAGATNGLAQTTTSIMRSIGPASATSLFALSIERNVLGGNLVYVMMTLLTAAAFMATLQFPTKPWKRNEDH
ncbi:MFS general substrate transporter [Ramaria rubella]|nr:MFS general substrate transporter [Ramaria rubella]